MAATIPVLRSGNLIVAIPIVENGWAWARLQWQVRLVSAFISIPKLTQAGLQFKANTMCSLHSTECHRHDASFRARKVKRHAGCGSTKRITKEDDKKARVQQKNRTVQGMGTSFRSREGECKMDRF